MKKKVWIINHYASDMFRDKAGRHYWFAQKLQEKGYEPTVFCANTFHNTKEVIAVGKEKFTFKKDNDIPYIFVKTCTSHGNGIDRVKNMFFFYHNLLRVVKKVEKVIEKPDVIIASSVHPLTMVAGIQIAKKLKVPCICEIRDLWPEAIFYFGKIKEKGIIGRLLTAGEHWIYRKADALIYTKEGDTDYLKEKGWTTDEGGDISLSKCHYINNGVNIEIFEQSIRENRIEASAFKKDTFNVVYAGILRPVNDVGKLLDCAKLLISETDIQFLIYGAGSQFEMLKGRVENEELHNVKMKGFIGRKFIPYILSRSSVNVLNYSQSKYNWSRGNSSNKLFEYMASGKPVLSTVKMGYDIIDKYKCGISLENNTPENLAKAIMEIKNMPKDEYLKLCNASKEGAKNFDFNVLVKRLIQVIESV